MTTTTLCFDFGNTRLKCGVFISGQLSEALTLENDKTETLQGLLNKYAPANSILSSVINHNGEIEKLLAQKTYFLKLDSAVKLPFTTPVSKPETIGADRLALAASAVHFYKGHNNLIIALGSCITYNFINKYNNFIGGSISPGMEMRFKSLNTFTAKLPIIKFDAKASGWNFPLIGYDTDTNILSGVILGMASEIDGIVNEYKEKFTNFNAVLTGGDSVNFEGHLKNKIFADPWLILKGLYAISEYNHGVKK